MVVGAAAQLLFFGHLAGINALAVTGLFLAVVWRLRRRPVDVRDLWIPAFAGTFAALLAVRTEPALVVFDLLAWLALALASAAALGGPLTTLPLTALTRRAADTVTAAIVRAWGLIEHERARPSPFPRFQGAAPYAAGVTLAIPLVGVFGLLFISADEVFAHALRDAVRGWPDALKEVPGRTALFTVVAWATAGTLTVLWSGDRPAGATQLPHPLRGETATTLLVCLDVLFAAFVAVQLAYLFGGRDTLDAAGIPYSTYARRGFFELVAAAVLVAGLLFALEVVSGRRGRVHIAAALVLVSLTGAVLASAWYRLDLYQRAYGWSELRVYALTAIVFLALALIVLEWAVAARRMITAAQPLAAVALLVAVGTNAVGPAALVARGNIARVIDPSGLPSDAQRTLDVVYLYRLGDAAVPVLVDALSALPEHERDCVDALLRWDLARRDVEIEPAWEEWNVDRQRALIALRAFARTIPPATRDDHRADTHLARRITAAFRGCP